MTHNNQILQGDQITQMVTFIACTLPDPKAGSRGHKFLTQLRMLTFDVDDCEATNRLDLPF